MSETTARSVTCDNCQRELVIDSSYPHEWGLELSAKDFGIKSGVTVYACICDPPIEETRHFCGIKCLYSWSRNQTN